MHKLLLDTSLLEELPVAIGIADFDGNIVYFNKQFTQTFGYTTSDVPNLEKWTKTVYPEENYRNWALNIWNCEVQRRMHTNVQPTPHEFNILCKDGETRIVEISFNIKDNYILTFFRDVTALAKSIENVSLEKKFSDKLINSLPGNFYLFERIEKQFKLIRWNKNFFNYLGYTTEQLESMPPKDIIAERSTKVLTILLLKFLKMAMANMSSL